MRIASWSWGGRCHVGTISADGREATPLAVADASRGALPLIEQLVGGGSLPGAAVSSQIDYESELAVVIGRGGRNIPRARAMDHVFGYTVVNDVSARDVQVR